MTSLSLKKYFPFSLALPTIIIILHLLNYALNESMYLPAQTLWQALPFFNLKQNILDATQDK